MLFLIHYEFQIGSFYVRVVAAIGHNQIMAKLNQIMLVVEKMLKRLSAVEGHLSTVQARSTVTETDSILRAISLPLATLEELTDVENRLQTDEIFRTAMVRFCLGK